MDSTLWGLLRLQVQREKESALVWGLALLGAEGGALGFPGVILIGEFKNKSGHLEHKKKKYL